MHRDLKPGTSLVAARTRAAPHAGDGLVRGRVRAARRSGLAWQCADHGPGKPWAARPAPAGRTRPPRRYDRSESGTPGAPPLAGAGRQLAALRQAECSRIFSRKISTHIRVRPELGNALSLCRDIEDTAPEQAVILSVHEMKRLARAAELLPLAPPAGRRPR